MSTSISPDVQMDFALPPEIEELESRARAFSAGVLRAELREAESAGTWSERAMRHFDELGIRGLALPAKLGGGGSALASVAAAEAIGDAAGILAADQPGPACGALAALPDVELANALAGACISGAGAVALALIRPHGKRRGLAPANSRPEALIAVDTETVTVFRAAELEVSPADAAALWDTVSVTATSPGEVFEVGADAAFGIRGAARTWMSAVLVGLAQAALDYVLDYGRERIVFDAPVLGHQANAFDLAAHTASVDAARVGTQTAARHYDNGDTLEAAWLGTQAYIAATEAALGSTDFGVQMLGGHGYVSDHPVEKWFREARTLVLLFGGADLAIEDLSSRSLDARDPLVV